MPRKSPYQHEVKGHIRSGMKIHKYKRGKGKKPSKPRKIIRKAEQKSFNVKIDDRNYKIEAVTFASALNMGLSRFTKTPTHIRIIRVGKD
ncbi:MAG: hypothetical protein ACFFDT_24060 [Candidatus Hodarchaeota archaeon]